MYTVYSRGSGWRKTLASHYSDYLAAWNPLKKIPKTRPDLLQ